MHRSFRSRRALALLVPLLMLTAVCLGQVPAAAQPGPDTPAPLRAVPNDDAWFGAVNTTSNMPATNAAGARWTRLIFPWEQIQPENGRQWEPGYFTDADITGQ